MPWVLLALYWVMGLSSSPLFDVDEGAFSEASREMLTSGDWGHTTLNGRDRFDKPIFIYWLQAASMAVLGTNESAARLPSALAGLLWCVVAARFAGRHLGVQTKDTWAVGFVMASCLGVMLIGRAATADAMLNVLIVLTMNWLWQHLSTGERRAQRLAFAAMGVGVLTKGPVAVLIPMASCGLYLLIERDWARIKRLLWDVPAWLLLLAVAAPWYLYALHRHGMAFIDGFIIQHNIGRYTTPMERHGGSVAYGLMVLPLLMLPWSALLGPVIANVRSLWSTPVTRWLCCWGLFVVVFFSVSGTKLPHYFLYGITPLLLLGVQLMYQAAPGHGVWPWALALPQLILLAGSGWAADLARFLASQTSAPAFKTLLENAPPSPHLGVVLLACGAWAWVWLNKAWPVYRRAALGAAVLAVWMVHAFIPWWARMQQGPIGELARAAATYPHTVTQYSTHMPSFAFYLGRPSPRRPPEPGEMALVRTDRLDTVPGAWVVCRQVNAYTLVWIKPTGNDPAALQGFAQSCGRPAP